MKKDTSTTTILRLLKISERLNAAPKINKPLRHFCRRLPFRRASCREGSLFYAKNFPNSRHKKPEKRNFQKKQTAIQPIRQKTTEKICYNKKRPPLHAVFFPNSRQFIGTSGYVSQEKIGRRITRTCLSREDEPWEHPDMPFKKKQGMGKYGHTRQAVDPYGHVSNR